MRIFAAVTVATVLAIYLFYLPGQGSREFSPISALDVMWITREEGAISNSEFGIRNAAHPASPFRLRFRARFRVGTPAVRIFDRARAVIAFPCPCSGEALPREEPPLTLFARNPLLNRKIRAQTMSKMAPPVNAPLRRGLPQQGRADSTLREGYRYEEPDCCRHAERQQHRRHTTISLECHFPLLPLGKSRRASPGVTFRGRVGGGWGRGK